MTLMFELKRIMKRNLIGYISIILVSIVLILLYNVVYINKDAINNTLINGNDKALSILDINKETFTSISGYYAFIFKILSLITSVYAINLGIDISTLDKAKNTRDFLYAKPIKRSNILDIRNVGAFIYMLSLAIIIFITSIILFSINKHSFNVLALIEVDFSLFLLMSVFYSLGLVIGGFKNGKFPNIIVSLIAVIPFILIHILSCFVNVSFLYYINPYSYFKLSEMVENGYQYNTIIITIFILVFLISFGKAIYENNLKEKKN